MGRFDYDDDYEVDGIHDAAVQAYARDPRNRQERQEKKERKKRNEDKRNARFDELEGGTVLDCVQCGFAYYSIHCEERPFNKDNVLPPQEHRICDRCSTSNIAAENIQRSISFKKGA